MRRAAVSKARRAEERPNSERYGLRADFRGVAEQGHHVGDNEVRIEILNPFGDGGFIEEEVGKGHEARLDDPLRELPRHGMEASDRERGDAEGRSFQGGGSRRDHRSIGVCEKLPSGSMIDSAGQIGGRPLLRWPRERNVDSSGNELLRGGDEARDGSRALT